MIIIGDTGNGGYWAIDLGQAKEDGEASIVEWIPGEQNNLGKQITDADFGSFLFRRLTEAL